MMWFNQFCRFGNFGPFGNIGNLGTFGWIMMILQAVVWLAIIAGVVLLIIWAVRRGGRGPAYVSTGQMTARDILKARYARGEITREEYQRMLEDLG
jgi:putative membrane protein